MASASSNGSRNTIERCDRTDILILNRGDFGSTGDIAYSQLQYFLGKGVSASFLALEKTKPLTTQIPGSNILQQINRFITKISGGDGFHNFSNTKKVIYHIKKMRPKMVFLHNLHGYYINFPRLIRFLSKANIRVVWTLHDCWAFTGKCPYFDAAKCEKWKTGCGHCPLKRAYPKALFFDRTKRMFAKKKDILLSCENVTYVLISDFMQERFQQSFLSTKSSALILDGVDTSFYVNRSKRNVKADFDSSGKKKMFLFAAASWSDYKGLSAIAKFKEAIVGKEAFIVVAGLSSEHSLHDGRSCFCLGRVDHARLADLYYSADVYINASLQESFGMTVVEAMACGTPVVSYDTGAAKSVITPQTGLVVPVGDLDMLLRSAFSALKKSYDPQELVRRSQKFSFEKMDSEYCRLYFDVFSRNPGL